MIVWEAAALAEKADRDIKIAGELKVADEIRRRKEEIRRSGGG